MVLNVMSTNNHIDSHHMYLPLFMFDMNPKWNMYMKEVSIMTINGMSTSNHLESHHV